METTRSSSTTTVTTTVSSAATTTTSSSSLKKRSKPEEDEHVPCNKMIPVLCLPSSLSSSSSCVVTSISCTSLSAKKARSEATNASAAVESASSSDLEEDTEEEDEFDVPQDMDDYLDDESVSEEAFSDTNSVSTTCSVGSNTPSIVGENLETISIAEIDHKMNCKAHNKFQENNGNTASNMNGIQSNENESNSKSSAALYTRPECPLSQSLFCHVPPSIHFVSHNEQHSRSLPPELRKHLRWKLSTITPTVVKKVVLNSGFRLMRRNCNDWMGTWGKHMKSQQFSALKWDQKLNHFPGTFNIGRKDRLWHNYHKLRVKHGKSDFAFLPRTFCLPNDTTVLKKVWEKRGVKAKWIVKPPALARGSGIKVINKWSQIPRTRPLVVQRYLSRPHLINGTKYDLRIYVLVTSVCPMRIFLYDEGLVRFASNAYDKKNESLSDIFMHLTNYSINKSSSSYVANDDPDNRQGHKWKLSSLWNHFREHNVDQALVWARIKDLVIKTILSGDHAILPLFNSSSPSHYCGFELFGFDVLLDADLKPWLIEVNISPSLHSSSPLDLEIKGALAAEMFNIARYHVPATNNRMSESSQLEAKEQLGLDVNTPLCFDFRLYTRQLSKADRTKQENVLNLYDDREAYSAKALEHLTPDDVRCLIRAEDELANAHHFHRIFPAHETHGYLRYLGERPSYYYLLLDAWEFRYASQRSEGIELLRKLCRERIHLIVPPMPPTSSSSKDAKMKKRVCTAKLRKKIDVSGLLKSSQTVPNASEPLKKEDSENDPGSEDKSKVVTESSATCP